MLRKSSRVSLMFVLASSFTLISCGVVPAQLAQSTDIRYEMLRKRRPSPTPTPVPTVAPTVAPTPVPTTAP
ncbi:MAG: hypothetical protein ACM3YO_02245, partial [Bacteroidota bacterium]